MKRWAVTTAAVVALAGLGLTAHGWVPWLTGLASSHKEGVESLNNLLELVSKLIAWLTAVSVFVYRLWRERKTRDAKRAPARSQTVHQMRAGHDAIQAGRNVQTGGANISGPVTISSGGDVRAVAAETYIEQQTIVQQTPPSCFAPLHQLPSPPADFTGREAELAELRAAMEQSGAYISGLQGQGGVGKTALALKVAEELSPNYPDAQIYFDLRGVSERPLSPADAMAYVIRTFHPEARLPQSDEELKATYLSVLHGKRVLLLMDNARDPAQVAPLVLPQSCALLVTSRLHFTLPGLREKRLDVLSAAQAEALLLKICSRINEQAGTVARLCGRLPLALRLAATALKEKENLDPADYVQRLEQHKLGALPAAGADPSTEASISLSYGLLSPEMQQRWRALGVFPDTFDGPAAAAVWQMEVGAAQDTLGRLLQYSMLEWNQTAKRYRLHDLMRDFARERLREAGETESAARRHASYYKDIMVAASNLYLPGRQGDALDLVDREWTNIQGGQAWAAANAAHDELAADLCSGYASRGGYVLEVRQPHVSKSGGSGLPWLQRAGAEIA